VNVEIGQGVRWRDGCARIARDARFITVPSRQAIRDPLNILQRVQHVPRIERPACRRGKHEVVILPTACSDSLLQLSRAMRPQCRDRFGEERNRPQGGRALRRLDMRPVIEDFDALSHAQLPGVEVYVLPSHTQRLATAHPGLHEQQPQWTVRVRRGYREE